MSFMAEKKTAKKKDAQEDNRPKIIVTTGKRKDAIARATIVSGNGNVRINGVPVNIWGNDFLRMKVTEPLVMAADLSAKANIDVNVRSGGIVGQAEAARMAIARALVNFSKDAKLKEKFIQYDRNMLVYDSRRNEPHHAGGASKRGSRRHKQRSKR